MRTFVFSICAFWAVSAGLTYLLGWAAVPLTVCSAALVYLAWNFDLRRENKSLIDAQKETADKLELVHQRLVKLENRRGI